MHWVSTGHFCKMKIRLRKNWLSNLAEREVPQHRNCWWSDEFMSNYDGYGFVLCMTCPTSCPSPTQLHSTPPYPTTYILSPHHKHPATPLPYHTTPHQVSNATNTSTILAKCLAGHCAWKRHSRGRGGGGVLRHIETFFFFPLQNYYHNGRGRGILIITVRDWADKQKKKKQKRPKS